MDYKLVSGVEEKISKLEQEVDEAGRDFEVEGFKKEMEVFLPNELVCFCQKREISRVSVVINLFLSNESDLRPQGILNPQNRENEVFVRGLAEEIFGNESSKELEDSKNS